MPKSSLHLSALILSCLLVACGSGRDEPGTDAAPPGGKAADLVLLGGEVATVDPALGNVEALAVESYRILDVGSDEQISAYIGHAYFANDAALEAAERQYVESLSAEERESQNRERIRLAGERTRNFIEDIEFYKKLEAAGELPVRLYMMERGVPLDNLDEALPVLKMLPEANDILTVRSIKKQIDGALGAHGAWLLQPYDDLPDSDGLVLETVEDIEMTAEHAVTHGYQLNTHAIGDRAAREVLDLCERVWAKMDVDGSKLRWRIEHAQHIQPEDVPRFGALGVIASIQAVHGTSDGPWIPTRLGEERAEVTSQPWRELFSTGAVITNGTDVPVERIDPIASYYSSVSRMMVNGERF